MTNFSVIPALDAGIYAGKIMDKQGYVYICANKRNGTIYVGVTSNLVKRIYEHRNSLVEGFTEKYNIKMLVWYEVHSDINEAIKREKALKRWNRHWKIDLIEKMNPEWKDLYDDIV